MKGYDMRLGVMQPYFFPYLGHFALIANCDKWVVFDVTQYTPKSWMTRNRILHPVQGWNYISVPLNNSSISIRTHEARISSFSDLQKSIEGKMSHYRKRAPYYSEVMKLVDAVFCIPTDSLVQLDVKALQAVCNYIEIPFNYVVASALDLDWGSVQHAGGWAPLISAGLGADQYINPIGGQSIFKEEDFFSKGVRLQFI
ncbi:MAG: WbqC family protein, partial [Mucilaginibacter sp.]|nr:WbqC family protein [Mucilaginibacter sp.]